MCVMAASNIIFAFSLVFLSLTFTDASKPLSEIIKSLGSTIENRLLDILDSVSGITALEKSYQILNDGPVKCIPVDGLALVQQMAAKVDEKVERQLLALKKLKETAEQAAQAYKYDPLLKLSNVTFINIKNLNEQRPTMKYSKRFQQKVDFTASGVHRPVEIFEGHPKFLNGIEWSAALDIVFKNNTFENPDFAWQVFGSRNGFMRVYPANNWKDIPNTADLYDVRRRPWYIQGSTSPKDMLILMDISGSVHGQTFHLMKHAVKTMLDTLEENDYVNVAWFNNEVGWATCFTTFVQANSWNKKKLLDGINALKDGNTTSYSNALEFAFLEFRKFNETKANNTGAECHQVVMIFTDGGTEKPEEVLKKYNADQAIRIFTYAVGAHAIPVHTIKWMACNYKGYFYSIPAMGSIHTTVQEYPNVLARPMAFSDSQFETWSTVYTDAGGLGMVISVTMPVFNRSDDNNEDKILGVVSIDTPVQDIALLTPKRQIGPIGYSFAINNNGFAIFHPKMRIEMEYLDDAPDVDFFDLEGDGKIKEGLRTAMIDGKKGSTSFITFVTTDDDHHIVEKQVNYHYTPIINASFSLALAIPAERGCYVRVTGMDSFIGINEHLNYLIDDILVANWNYCSNVKYRGNTTLFLQELLLAIQTNIEKCDEELVQHLLWDLERTRNIPEHWKTQTELRKIVLSVFLGTEGGLTRFYSKNNEFSKYLNVLDPFKASYYKKALYYSGWTFMIDRQYENTENQSIITAVRAITNIMNKTSSAYHYPGVVGVRLNETMVRDIFQTTECKNEDTLVCYLLDDGGFILTTNQEEHQNGKFLGDEDPWLMHRLTNNSVYKRRLEYEYHAVCTKPKPVISAGRSRFTSSLKSLVETGFHLLLDGFIWLSLTGWNTDKMAVYASDDVGTSVRTDNYSCTKVRALYYFKPNSDQKPIDGDVVCGNCSRKFSAQHLSHTNMLLVIIKQPNCPMTMCQESPPQLMHKPQETDEPNICGMAPRYRRRPQPCFHTHPLENVTTFTCGSGHKLTTSFYLVAMIVSVSYVQ